MRSPSRLSLFLVVGGALGFAVLAAFLVPWSWVPGGHVDPVEPSQVFTPLQLERMDDYAGTERLLTWISVLLGLAVALVLGLTPIGGRLSGRRRWPWWTRVPVGTAVVLALSWLATLPVQLLLRQHRVSAGLTRQGLGSWLLDEATALAVSVTFMAVVLLVLVGLARHAPRRWPLWGAALAGGLVVLGSFVYPLLVEPLFNNFASLPQGEMRTSIMQLAEREGVSLADVEVVDASRRTTTLNAYVSGFGSSRHLVLYDTLLRRLTPGEVRVVAAHELAHAKYQDVLLGTGLGALGAVVGVGLLGLVLRMETLRRASGIFGVADPRLAALGAALLAVGGFLASPVENVVSRAVEARADRESLTVTRDYGAFVSMQKRLALTSLADPEPPWLTQVWFGSHPSTVERLGMVESITGKRIGR